MEKCNDIIEDDCSNSCDLKGDVLGTSSMSCVSDNLDLRNKTLEDTNRNLTVLKSKGKMVLDDPNSSSSSKEKTNVGWHVGPNGLLNGIGIENSFTNCLDTHKSELLDKSSSSSHTSLTSSNPIHKTPCETNTVDIGLELSEKIIDERTENITSDVKTDHSSASAVFSTVDLKLMNIPKPSSTECCESAGETNDESEVQYVSYVSELQMPDIMRLIQKDLSEPYSIYTYRYFIHNWPKLCFLAMDSTKCVGAIVCKLDIHRKVVKRGYIAMLAVDEKYRKKKIGSNLVLKAIRAMVADDADEVVLETEITNRPALRLYENLGFVRDKRLFRYYLNGVDALRLKLWLR